jgi:hypothetical protein
MNILIINPNREFLAPPLSFSELMVPPTTTTTLKSWCIIGQGMFVLQDMDAPKNP